ncbi:MAG TPA: hypothetical protein VIJ93_14225, partial [bacterium]
WQNFPFHPGHKAGGFGWKGFLIPGLRKPKEEGDGRVSIERPISGEPLFSCSYRLSIPLGLHPSGSWLSEDWGRQTGWRLGKEVSLIFDLQREGCCGVPLRNQSLVRKKRRKRNIHRQDAKHLGTAAKVQRPRKTKNNFFVCSSQKVWLNLVMRKTF